MASDMDEFSDNDLVSQYLRIRDLKEVKERECAEAMVPYTVNMALIEQEMNRRLTARGAENTKTEAGTAYKQTLASVKVLDRQEWLNYVQDHAAWHLLTNHVNKKEIEEVIEVTGGIPPGLEVSRIVKVNFRRS